MSVFHPDRLFVVGQTDNRTTRRSTHRRCSELHFSSLRCGSFARSEGGAGKLVNIFLSSCEISQSADQRRIGDHCSGLEDLEADSLRLERGVKEWKCCRSIALGNSEDCLSPHIRIHVGRSCDERLSNVGRVQVKLGQQQGRPVAVRTIWVASKRDQRMKIGFPAPAAPQRQFLGNEVLEESGRRLVSFGHAPDVSHADRGLQSPPRAEEPAGRAGRRRACLLTTQTRCSIPRSCVRVADTRSARQHGASNEGGQVGSCQSSGLFVVPGRVRGGP